MRMVLWAAAAVVLSAFSAAAVILLVDAVLLGALKPSFARKVRGPELLITAPNCIEVQTGLECSGYAAAYVLRHFGQAAQGHELYERMPHKMRGGTVYPKGVRAMLRAHGLRVSYRTGSLAALKNEVSRGAPVIVMLRVRKDRPWLHYVPVVGYDQEHLYLAESLPECINAAHAHYNRRLTHAEFLSLWNTAAVKMPLYRNTYFSAAPRSTPSS